MIDHRLSRRSMLRGLGVSVALPWMESMQVWGDVSSPTSVSSEAPIRMAILFSECGYHRNQWWAKGQGPSMELGKVLHPLNDFRERMIFIRGLYNAEALKAISTVHRQAIYCQVHLWPRVEEFRVVPAWTR